MKKSSTVKTKVEYFERKEIDRAFKFCCAMCGRAQELMFKQMCDCSEKSRDSMELGKLLNSLIYHYEKFKNIKMSPIEQIFTIGLVIYFSQCAGETMGKHEIICRATQWVIEPQAEIEYRDKKYIADFAVDFSKKQSEKFDRIILKYSFLKKRKYVIELDGHDYHSTKEQQNSDYDRENNLKELGYNVIRFTGSQVFRDPVKCVDKMIKIITSEIKKEDKR